MSKSAWTISALALAAAAVAATPSLAGERLQAAAVAAQLGGGAFEFRGSGKSSSGFENVVWKFTPDGRVEGTVAKSRIMQGGILEE